MVKEWKKGSWLWGLAAGAGLALVMAAVPLLSGGIPVAHAQTSTPTATTPPTATATPNPDCVLRVTKDAAASTVPEGGEITYTITVENNGSGSGNCTDLTVTDVIPDDTDCTDATATDDAGLDINIDGCDSSGTVTWDTNDNLDTDDQVVLKMVVELTSGASEDDRINNEACATSASDVGGDCDSARVTVTSATATPTTGPTATPGPTVVVPTVRPTTPPVIVVQPTISGPATGTGTSDSTSSRPLPLALGLLGGLLVLGSGVALVKRTR